MHHGFGNMLLAWIIPIALIVIIGISIYMIGKNKNENGETTSNSALEILNERFAKGEIDEEEYKKKKETLSKYSP